MEELYSAHHFPTKARFITLLKENDLYTTAKSVDEFLKQQTVHQITQKEKKVEKKMKFITAYSENEIIQVDLIVYSKLASTNKGFQYILICLDVFTRKMHCAPLKNKTPDECKRGFISLFGDTDIECILTDDGNEYRGSFDKYMDERGTVHLWTSSQNHSRLGIVDRACLTLRTTIQRYMLGADTTNWVDKLADFVKAYNESSHRGILGMSPDQVSDDKQAAELISVLNSKKEEHNHAVGRLAPPKPEYAVGDYVRVKLRSDAFKKGFTATYSTHVYKVIDVPNHFVCKLDNDQTHEQKNLQKVPGYTEAKYRAQRVSAVDRADHRARVKRRLDAEGLT